MTLIIYGIRKKGYDIKINFMYYRFYCVSLLNNRKRNTWVTIGWARNL